MVAAWGISQSSSSWMGTPFPIARIGQAICDGPGPGQAGGGSVGPGGVHCRYVLIFDNHEEVGWERRVSAHDCQQRPSSPRGLEQILVWAEENVSRWTFSLENEMRPCGIWGRCVHAAAGEVEPGWDLGYEPWQGNRRHGNWEEDAGGTVEAGRHR
jgi:hypothetical protein